MTLAQIVADIQSRLDDTEFDTAALKRWINFGQADIANRAKWSFLQGTDTSITTVAGDSSYSLPTDFKKVYDIVDLTNGTVLTKAIVKTIDTNIPTPADDTQNKPTEYYIWNGALYLSPVPDGAYNLQIRYYKNLADMTDDGNVSAIPTQYHELLALYGYFKALQFNDDFDLARDVKAEYENGITLMKRDFLQDVDFPQRISYSTHKKSGVSKWTALSD